MGCAWGAGGRSQRGRATGGRVAAGRWRGCRAAVAAPMVAGKEADPKNRHRASGRSEPTAGESGVDGRPGFCAGTWAVVRSQTRRSRTSSFARDARRPAGIIEIGDCSRARMSAVATTVSRSTRWRVSGGAPSGGGVAGEGAAVARGDGDEGIGFHHHFARVDDGGEEVVAVGAGELGVGEEAFEFREVGRLVRSGLGDGARETAAGGPSTRCRRRAAKAVTSRFGTVFFWRVAQSARAVVGRPERVKMAWALSAANGASARRMSGRGSTGVVRSWSRASWVWRSRFCGFRRRNFRRPRGGRSRPNRAPSAG